MNYIKCDNGFNKWVVFVHGIGGSLNTWKKQIEDFSKEYNLILLDLPGHGNSQNEQPKKIKISKINKKIIDILQENEIKKADFVGMSMGALVVANFAIKFPEFVNSIVFGGAAIKITGIYNILMRLTQKIKRKVPYKFFYQTLSFVMMPKKNHQKSRRIFIQELVKMKKETFFAWVEYLKNTIQPENLLKKLSDTNIKILFVSGDEDKCFIKGTKKAVEMMNNSTLHIIKHCGHICTIEKFQEFNRISLSFLHSVYSPVIA